MKPGDYVKVVDKGQLYSTYEEMARRLKATNWVRGRNNIRNGETCQVIRMCALDPACILIRKLNGEEYIINWRGLEAIDIKIEWIKLIFSILSKVYGDEKD